MWANDRVCFESWRDMSEFSPNKEQILRENLQYAMVLMDAGRSRAEVQAALEAEFKVRGLLYENAEAITNQIFDVRDKQRNKSIERGLRLGPILFVIGVMTIVFTTTLHPTHEGFFCVIAAGTVVAGMIVYMQGIILRNRMTEEKRTWANSQVNDIIGDAWKEEKTDLLQEPAQTAESEANRSKTDDPDAYGYEAPEGFDLLGSFDPIDAQQWVKRFEEEAIIFQTNIKKRSTETSQGSFRKRDLTELFVRHEDVTKANNIISGDWKV
jgi:hypothetical protein